ncbi:hypothetical protein DOY81_002891 [Sarcophaga bullata]|nr:hypothetical protein DOY81_002891 [Sarcophaga bullata]
MGNRVSNLLCTKTNLAIKDKDSNENSNSKVKRESKRRFRQRRLSLNCIARETDTTSENKSVKEPVLVHKPSASLPRHSKLLQTDENPPLTEPAVKKEDFPKETVGITTTTTSEQTTVIPNEKIFFSTATTPNKTSLYTTTSTLPARVENLLESVKPVPIESFKNTFSSPLINSSANISLSSPPSSSLSTPAKKFSTATTPLDVVDSPIRVLATTRTEDILTREKLTCSVSSLKKSTMKFNTDLTTTTSTSTVKVSSVQN